MNRFSSSQYPSLPQAWGIFGIFVAVSLGLGLMLAALLPAIGINNQSIINFIGYNVSLPLVIWIAWRMKPGTGPEKRTLYFNSIPVILYVILLLISLSLNVVLDPITLAIPMPEFIEELFAMLTKRDIWTFLTVGITGPILEEVLFRGVILDGFLNRYKPGKAIFWSALLFGLFHMNPWQFIPAFLIGLLLGYIYFKTRSLFPVIFIHIINNSFSYLMVYIFGDEVQSYRDIFTENIPYLIFIAVSLLVLVVCLTWLIRTIKEESHFKKEIQLEQ
jgi:membrane protease YdiL (CAAX protease family)